MHRGSVRRCHNANRHRNGCTRGRREDAKGKHWIAFRDRCLQSSPHGSHPRTSFFRTHLRVRNSVSGVLSPAGKTDKPAVFRVAYVESLVSRGFEESRCQCYQRGAYRVQLCESYLKAVCTLLRHFTGPTDTNSPGVRCT